MQGRKKKKKPTQSFLFVQAPDSGGKTEGRRSEASPRSQAEALTNLGTARPASQEMLL